jgi:transposase InsO family protein
VLSDNGTCFKRRWSEACAEHRIAVRKKRAYRPQTNGKAERFIRTLLERCAYAYPYEREAERLAALPAALDFYNRFRPHRALARLAPLQRVLLRPDRLRHCASAGALRGARLGGWYGPGSGLRSRCS